MATDNLATIHGASTTSCSVPIDRESIDDTCFFHCVVLHGLISVLALGPTRQTYRHLAPIASTPRSCPLAGQPLINASTSGNGAMGARHVHTSVTTRLFSPRMIKNQTGRGGICEDHRVSLQSPLKDVHIMATEKASPSSTPPTLHAENMPTQLPHPHHHNLHLHPENHGYRHTSVPGATAFAEHGPLVDHKIPQDDVVQSEPDLLWSRIRHWAREPLAEFFGVFILILFGDGVVAQVVLSNGEKGEYQSISWGWG